jgi:uncharacterized protein (DUF169 family)
MMTLGKNDWEVLERFKFESHPVGVKYFTTTAKGMLRLKKNLSLCEMLKAAFDGDTFFAAARNQTCDAALHVLGQKDIAQQYISGEFGSELQVFRDKRAAARLYHYIPRMAKGSVKYVALSPLNKLPFDPDVLIILANTGQAEILLRAMSYRTGRMWQSRYSSAIGCAWLLIQPYLSGDINFIPTGLGFGMRRRKMPWKPRPYQPDGLEYVKRVRIRIGLDKR